MQRLQKMPAIGLSYLLNILFMFMVLLNMHLAVSAQNYTTYLDNTSWTLTKYEIIDINQIYEGKALQDRIQEFVGEFAENKTFFEFDKNHKFSFIMEAKPTIIGQWAVVEDGRVFNIYADESTGNSYEVNFDFTLEHISEDKFIISMKQDEEDTTFKFKLVFSKK